MTSRVDKTGVPVTDVGDSENCYSAKLTDYFYKKQNDIDVNNEFTQAEITEYGLEVSSNKVNISTTGRLIKYLKAFAKKYNKKIEDKIEDKVEVSDYNSDMQKVNLALQRLDSRLTSVKSEVIDKIYPKGSVYMTFDSRNPNTLFGVGQWVKIENAFLYGSGKYNVEETGGFEKMYLQEPNLPFHRHSTIPHSHSLPGGYFIMGVEGADVKLSDNNKVISKGGKYSIMYSTEKTNVGQFASITETTVYTQGTGEGEPVNNMPPYKVVHMWRRVA